MGVTGLWKLIEPCGQPVPLETLECKILAVDISIWLHQVVKGFQDNKGSALPNAHLLGLFHRLCKLLYYRVKPVFVFDGCVPQLKRDTIARRQLQRSKLNNEAERIQALLLQSLAKEKVVQQALGANTAELLAKSPNKGVRKTSTGSDDIFKLPDIPCATEPDTENEVGEYTDPYNSCNDDSTCEYATTSTDESFDDSTARHYYNSNLQAIDVKSIHFKALPANVRHDILIDIKETRKQSSWGRLHELPAKGDDFSFFQMKRLLKRRAVQESIEEVEQEMGGRILTFNELQTLLTEEDIVEKSTINEGTKKISSDDNTRFLLVRDLNKKQATDNETIKVEKIESKPENPCSSKPTFDNTKNTDNQMDKFGTEFDKDLELAIALSLEESTVYNEKDYDYDSDQDLKLNKEQSKLLKNAAIGPARAFMIEYAGVNNDEILGIMEKTQNIDDLELTIDDIEKQPSPKKEYSENERSSHKLSDGGLVVHDSQKELNSDLKTMAQQVISQENESKVSQSSVLTSSGQTIDSSDSDSEFEEVPFDDNKINKTEIKINIQECAALDKKLEVVVDLTKSLDPEEDLFSDVFKANINDIEEKNAIPLESMSTNDKTSPTDPQKLTINTALNELSKHSGNITNITLDTQDSLVERLTSTDGSTSSDKFMLSNAHISNVADLLDELKKQTEDIKKIKLEDIQLDSSITNLSDKNLSEDSLNENTKNNILNTPKRKETCAEIIEILDEECTEKKCNAKSPLLKTPSKGNSITEYFQAEYVIKRTPEAPTRRDEEASKVKSPFFVNKKRSAEKATNLPCTDAKVSKATKSLFPSHQEYVLDDGVTALDKKALSAEEVLNDAACALKEHVSAEELKDLASNIAKEKRQLENERNRQDRMGMGITQRMSSECQQLLRLFGIPYIVAPMEAEAQCAYLDGIGLTNGTITDDSDIWLFGGRTVYKNFFAQNKHVLEFRAENIEKSFNCDRSKLIQLACLVGSDYTTGIHGIGAVTAMEILATFCSKEQIQNTKSSVTAILTSLSRFRDWWIASKTASAPPGSSARLALRKKLKNIELHDGFPNIAVVDAYLSPKIDANKEGFAWGFPDVESIREFARKTFGWTTCKTDEVLMPIIKKINEKKTQATIKNYFSVKSTVSLRQLKVSKRIQNAIDTMSGKVDEQAEEKTKSKAKRTQRKKRKSDLNLDDVNVDESNIDLSSHSTAVPNKSAKLSSSKKGDKKKAVLANSKEEIPQRVKDLEEMRKKKESAAKILNKSKKINKKGT